MLIYFLLIEAVCMNIGIERSLQSHDLLTFMYLLIFVLITFTKLKFPKKLSALCTCFFSKIFFVDYAIELSAIFSVFKTILFFIQNLIFSFFIFNMYGLLFPNTTIEVTLFFQIFVSISLLLMTQYLVGIGISKLFRFRDLYMSIHALRFGYLKMISFLILPFLLYQSYGRYDDELLVGTIITVFLGLLLLLRIVLIVVNNNKIIIERLFYFIVYLCTLEIVPLLLIYKLAVK